MSLSLSLKACLLFGITQVGKSKKAFFGGGPQVFPPATRIYYKKGEKYLLNYPLSKLFKKKLNPNIQYTQENVADCKITKNLVKPEKRVLFQSAHRQIKDSINAHNEIPSFMW